MYQFPRGPQQNTLDRVAYAAEIYFLTILESRNEIKMSLKLISSDASSLTEDGLPLSVFTWSSLYTCVCMRVQSWPPLCCPMDCTCQAPLSMEFSRQEYWSGLLLPTPGDLPDPGMKPTTLASPTLTKGVFTTDVTWEALSVSWPLIKTSLRRLEL